MVGTVPKINSKSNKISKTLSKGKGNAIPVKAFSGPGVSRTVEVPYFKTIGTRKW